MLTFLYLINMQNNESVASKVASKEHKKSIICLKKKKYTILHSSLTKKGSGIVCSDMNDAVIVASDVIGNDIVGSDIIGNDILVIDIIGDDLVGVTLHDIVGSEITGSDIVDYDIIDNENLAVR